MALFWLHNSTNYYTKHFKKISETLSESRRALGLMHDGECTSPEDGRERTLCIVETFGGRVLDVRTLP